MLPITDTNCRLSDEQPRCRESDRGLIHEWFEARAASHPDAVALRCEARFLTYGELNRRANRLARRLRDLGVGPGVLVGLSAERSVDLVVGIVAILKAGGAYLPIDPSYPSHRQALLVADAGAPILLTQAALRDRLPDHSARIELLDDDAGWPAGDGNLARTAGPDDLAYVIYTSGSTGQPKGVQVTHGNVVWLLENTEGCYGFGERDVWTLFHSASFDVSVYELWGALAYGGRLVVVPYRVSRSPEDFYRLVRDERVTVLSQTPSAFRQLIRAEERLGEPAGSLDLRYVILAGESIEPQALKLWFDRHGDRRPLVVNMYGITETTVHVTFRPLTKADLDGPGGGTPIGQPIPNSRIHLLDQGMRPVPAGEPGEIYVGGLGVARGYLNRPDLTAQRFIPDPFGGGPGDRLYRSGDLARLRPDGELESLGRIDHQVKIRGFRIELGEIEAALARCRGVRESAVVARDDDLGQKRLVAYVAGAAPDPAELRRRLTAELPDYMVPAAFVVLDALPLNGNGKIDRAALPAVASLAPAPAPADGDTEARVAAVWAEVLGCRAGPDDNFYDLGGTSISLVEVHTRLRERFGADLPLVDLFEHPTVRSLARYLDGRPAARPGQTDADRAARQREAVARQRAARGAGQ